MEPRSTSPGRIDGASVDGQTVIVAARWLLVAAGLLVALWHPAPVGELRVQIAVVLFLAVTNFHLHAQLLLRRRSVAEVAYGASIADLAVITLLVISQGGYRSDLFVFYFPALLAIGVALPTRLAAPAAAATCGVYWLVGLATLGRDGDSVMLAIRVLMLAGVALCGNVYWRLEAGKRPAPVAEPTPAPA